MTLPLYFVGGTIGAVLLVFRVSSNFVFWSIVLAFLGFGGVLYCWSVIETISDEYSHYFMRAKVLIWTGVISIASGAYVSQLQFLTFKSFGSDLPLWDVLNWARAWMEIGGVFLSGVGALSVRSMMPLHAVQSKKEDRRPTSGTVWIVGLSVRLTAFLALMVGYFGSILFPLPSLILFVVAGILYIVIIFTGTWRLLTSGPGKKR